MTENIETEQPTFNGMARQAMVMGSPCPLSLCVVLSVRWQL